MRRHGNAHRLGPGSGPGPPGVQSNQLPAEVLPVGAQTSDPTCAASKRWYRFVGGHFMRTTLFVGVLMAFAFAMGPARADGGRLCPSMSKALVSKVAAWIKGKGQCKAFCTGCGCKGGPGFRDSEGTACVGQR